MPFLLDGNPTTSEISDAVNYLLNNFNQSYSVDNVTGQVTNSNGEVDSYLYKYLYVKYSDSFDGTVNFTNSPTGRSYYGLRNSDSPTESTNPADYIWYKATPPAFGTTYFVYYLVTGGRRINIIVSNAAPSPLWVPEPGTAIDLDIISSADGASTRICYAKSTSFALASTPTTYQTSGSSGFPPYNTWGGAETWQATPPTLGVNEALFQSDGIYNPTTNLTTWNVPYLSNLKVGALSAITANLGSITAGSLNAVSIASSTLTSNTIQTSSITSGSSPAISGTGMTGSGINLYNDGRVAIGNSSNNIVWNNSGIYVQGNLQSSNYSPSTTGWQILNDGSAEFNGPVISRTLAVASGTYGAFNGSFVNIRSGPLAFTISGNNYYDQTAISGYTPLYIDTGYATQPWSNPKDAFIFEAGISTSVNISYSGSPGYYLKIFCSTIELLLGWNWNGGATIVAKVYVYVSPGSSTVTAWNCGGVDWALYKVS